MSGLPAPIQACIGLGANLGAAVQTVQQAVAALGQLPETRLVAQSSLYRSAPVEASGPDFVNAVAVLETALTPEQLLAGLQQLEQDAGRERPFRNAPRTLDLDLLLHGNRVQDDPLLTLPHPRMHRRAFVLVPLAEVWPDLTLPGHGPLQALLSTLGDQRIERLFP